MGRNLKYDEAVKRIEMRLPNSSVAKLDYLAKTENLSRTEKIVQMIQRFGNEPAPLPEPEIIEKIVEKEVEVEKMVVKHSYWPGIAAFFVLVGLTIGGWFFFFSGNC